MYLTDLTFIEDGNVDEIQDGLINFNKRKMIAATILEIQSYQEPPFCLKPLPEIQQFIMNARKFTDTDVLYNFSQYMEPRENAPQPPMPPELAEIVEMKENLKARRKLAKANAPKTKKAQKRRSKKQKKKKMLVQNLFSKEKDVWIKTEDTEPNKDLLSTEAAQNSSDTGTSNMDSSDHTSKDNQSEESSDQDIFAQIFSKQIDNINSKFDAHTSIMESMFQKLLNDVTTIKDASLRNFMEERESIVKELESMKKEFNDVSEVGWMTRQQHEEELGDLRHQNEEIRQILQKRGLCIYSDSLPEDSTDYDTESGEDKI